MCDQKLKKDFKQNDEYKVQNVVACHKKGGASSK